MEIQNIDRESRRRLEERGIFSSFYAAPAIAELVAIGASSSDTRLPCIACISNDYHFMDTEQKHAASSLPYPADLAAVKP